MTTVKNNLAIIMEFFSLCLAIQFGSQTSIDIPLADIGDR